MFPSAFSALSAVKSSLSRALRGPERSVGPAAEARAQDNRRGRRERREEQKSLVFIDAPPTSSALSAVRFALSRALRRPGAIVEPAARTRTLINRRGRRARRVEQQSARVNRCSPSAISAPSAVKSDQLRALQGPERRVGPAAEARTQINRRGREERREEQGRAVLTGCVPSATSALSTVKFALSRALRGPRSDAWNRRQEQERGFNRRGREERREEQGRAVLTGCPPPRPQRPPR
jgi:hypothetical protein